MVAAYRFHPTILREYDIRGVIGKTLGEADALAVGRAFGTVIREEAGAGARCCVGYDGRRESPVLEEALIAGLTETGIDVVRIGVGPTPMLYFSVYHLSTAAGIMITGSHNPKEYNGFKLMLGRRSFFGADIARLGEIAAAGEFARGKGRVQQNSVADAYAEVLANAWPGYSGNVRKVAWDPGNGAAGELTRALTRRLPASHVLMNETIDGTFPNHHPDPAVEANLAQLREAVAENGCDLGFALDGDGDRLGVVDGQGRILWPDQILAVLAREVLETKSGRMVIGDVKCSQALFDEVARLGGVPLMWKTGHALIKTKMAEERAVLAGEMSGHIFFADRYFGYDDALYAAVRLLAYLDRKGESLADIFDSLPQLVNTPEIRFACAEERKFAVVDELRDRLKAEGADVNDIDGVRVTTPDGWWLVRASNTQAVLVARAEAVDDDALAALTAAMAAQLKKSGVALPE
ncbi:MAG: phosphomannomutase/phosphoglucomutase [Proteobacteria bacterium]|nr:phosphomannomutase/phosphoglucomutase [Pseudomonadota bacterium]